MEEKKNNRSLGTVLLKALTISVVIVAILFLAADLYLKYQDTAEEKRLAQELEPEANQDDPADVVTYTQEEVDQMLKDAIAMAQTETRQQVLDYLRVNLNQNDSIIKPVRMLYPDYMIVANAGVYKYVPILDTIPHNDYCLEDLKVLDTGEYQYMTNGEVTSYKGIDVSKHQGNIDWNKVAADGVDFAFIRVGLRGYSVGAIADDATFDANMQGANAAGVKAGVYFFSQAINEEEIREEAQYVLDHIAPYKIDCPVVLDIEKISGDQARQNALSMEERTRLALIFLQIIEDAGYKPMLYHNLEMAACMIDIEQFTKYEKWFAAYNLDFYYPYDYAIWQYSDKGRVNGVSGNVDLDIAFKPIWE